MKKESFTSKRKNIHNGIFQIAFLFVFCLLVSNMTAYAAEEVTAGDWTYTYTADGATITAYNGSSSVIQIPSSINGRTVIGIASYALKNSSMTSLTIPETITSIGYQAFYNCRNLSAINFNAINCSDCNSSGGTFYNAGANAGSLKVIFGAKVKQIPEYLFSVSSSNEYAHVTSVKMSDTIREIGRCAFKNCYDLKTVTWGSSIETIESYAFYNCRKLTGVTIPVTTKSIGYEAFYDCRNLSSIKFNAENCADCSDTSTFYNAGSESASLKVVFGSKVKVIPSKLFCAGKDYDYGDGVYAHITSVTMSNGIKDIGKQAFENCYDLKTVTWGNSIETINSYAFYNCRALTDVVIPATTKSIGYQAFYDCQKLTSIKFNAVNCAECSNASTFYNAGGESSSLEVVFGSGVKVIPKRLFYVDAIYNSGDGAYAHITSVKMSDTIKTIGGSAFENCYELNNVIWGTAIETFGSYAFYNCRALTDVTIPTTTKSIGYEAFYDCQKLSSIKFNAENCADCDSWGGTFYNAGSESTSLKVVFGSKVKVIPSDLFYVSEDYDYGDGDYAHVTSVEMSGSILQVGSNAFKNCYDLKSVSWGSKLSVIKSYAFENCYGLTTVRIPSTVKTVGYAAFRNCSNLKKAVIKAKKAEFDRYVFDGCHDALKIYCYRGSTAVQYAKDNEIKYSYLDPASVSISSVSNTGSGVKITWKKAAGASGYCVFRKTASTGYKKIKTITSASNLTYTDTAVKDKNGSTYYYTVKAYNSTASSSSYTSKKIVRLKGIGISSLQNKSGKKMYVSWGKNTKASGYQVQYSTSSSFKSKKTVTVSGYKNVSKTISSLTKGKKYYVRVRAYKKSSNVNYYSAWSSVKSVKISK